LPAVATTPVGGAGAVVALTWVDVPLTPPSFTAVST
jgi:hypothetical protein